MSLIVQKFGGSSVADAAGIQRVARRIADTVRAGNRVCVVVSAMGDTTDELLDLAAELTQDAPAREMDILLSAGERISMSLLAMAIHAEGVEARSYTGSQAGMLTDTSYGRARIVKVNPHRVQEALDAGRVAIVAGFQGMSPESKDITTMGRGGSDTTAVALAAALGADVCEIYTDVDGVYSADPRVVPTARKLTELSSEETLEMAASGSKVLHLRSVEYARRFGVPLHVRSSFSDHEGTWIMPDPNDTITLQEGAPMVDSIGRRNTLSESLEVWAMASKDWARKISDVPEGTRRQWRADRALRAPMRSPGRPQPSREVQRQFWRVIATGVTTVEASLTVGVSWPVGARWFRHAGGMTPLSLAEPTGRYLSFAEREEIAILHAQGQGVRQIARTLGRDPGTISRELRRNCATRSGKQEYRATVAQWKAQEAARRPKPAKLATNQRLHDYVQARLNGVVLGPDGVAVPGPVGPGFKGRKMKPRRADRRWSTAWSPEQISHRLRLEFPDDVSMRISHEAIYQSLFIQGRGALKRELVACLRTGRALREPRARTRNKPQGHVTEDVVFSKRPPEAADRAVPGHWEGDLIIGTERSAIGTLAERKSRATILVHLPRLEGWGERPPVKNGPSLGGYGAEAMTAALIKAMATVPEQLRQSLTWDRGKELAGHVQFTMATGTKVFFADPHSPWQRPTNENTNGVLRQYFPKGTDLSRWSAEDLAAVAYTLNNRPRKVLDWKTPAEVFAEQLRSLSTHGVATTG